MTKLNKTSDYSMFKKHENNRAIDPLNLQEDHKLAENSKPA